MYDWVAGHFLASCLFSSRSLDALTWMVMGWLGIGAVAICSRRRRGAADLFVGRLVTKWAPGSSPHGDRTGAFGMEGRRGEWKGRNRTLAIGCLALASGSGQRVALVRNQPLVT